jgi:lysozyme family protein
MAKRNFDRCHEVTAKWEGGWSNHPSDPGGKTMYGVTEAVYHAWLRAQGLPTKPVRGITKAEALALYKSEYWHAAKCETLAAGVDLAVYDASVNSGVGRGRKWLLASIGGPDVQTVKNICRKRLSFMQGLAIFKTFGRGWTNRVADIEAKGVAWALAAVTTGGVVKKTLERESESARSTAGKQTTGGGAAGGGGAVAAPEAADQMAAGSLVVFIVLVAIVAGFLLWRAKVNKARANAYAEEASKL